MDSGGLIFTAKAGETPLEDLSGLRLKIPYVTRAQLDAAEARNIRKALLKYHGRGGKPPCFDTMFFRALHRAMFGDVWIWAGDWRRMQTNIGSPPERILQDMIILERDLHCRTHDLESGIWLHHRAVQIHPFENGNGRWARLLSDLWLKGRAGIIVRWPAGLERESPLRADYIKALKAADALDYGPLEALYKGLV